MAVVRSPPRGTGANGSAMGCVPAPDARRCAGGGSARRRTLTAARPAARGSSAGPAASRDGPRAGRRKGRSPAPRSGGAGPGRPCPVDKVAGWTASADRPPIAANLHGSGPAPCLSCRGLATSTSPHRKARTNPRRRRQRHASRDSRAIERGSGIGRDGVHRPRLSTKCRVASAHGRLEGPATGPFAASSPRGTRRRRRTRRGPDRRMPAPPRHEIGP